MQDLIDKTHSQHFELYRRNRLESMGFSDGDGEKKQMSLQETYELRRQDYMKDIQTREEEMRQRFVNKVKEKEAELKQSEQEVRYFTVADFFFFFFFEENLSQQQSALIICKGKNEIPKGYCFTLHIIPVHRLIKRD